MSLRATTIEARNSSTTTLAAGEVFTGDKVDVASWASVSVFVHSDASSAKDGLWLQSSTDGENWDETKKYQVDSNDSLTVGINVKTRFFRVVYHNGSNSQNSFRLQTVCNIYRQESLFSGSPADFVPVRITNGGKFDDGDLIKDLQTRTTLALEALTKEQMLSNRYLAEIVGEHFDETDIDHEE